MDKEGKEHNWVMKSILEVCRPLIGYCPIKSGPWDVMMMQIMQYSFCQTRSRRAW